MKNLLLLAILTLLSCTNKAQINRQRDEQISKAIKEQLQHPVNKQPVRIEKFALLQVDSLSEKEFFSLKMERFTEKVSFGEQHAARSEEMLAYFTDSHNKLPGITTKEKLDSIQKKRDQAIADLERARTSRDSFSKVLNGSGNIFYGFMVTVDYSAHVGDHKNSGTSQYMVDKNMRVSLYVPPYKEE